MHCGVRATGAGTCPLFWRRTPCIQPRSTRCVPECVRCDISRDQPGADVGGSAISQPTSAPKATTRLPELLRKREGRGGSHAAQTRIGSPDRAGDYHPLRLIVGHGNHTSRYLPALVTDRCCGLAAVGKSRAGRRRPATNGRSPCPAVVPTPNPIPGTGTQSTPAAILTAGACQGSALPCGSRDKSRAGSLGPHGI
jgi:hypothetical protein